MQLRQGMYDLPWLSADDRKRMALVFTWPLLRGEPKLAWLQLWCTLGIESKTIRITASAVGAFQGTSDTAGKRCLQALVKEGLVELIDRTGGQWMLYLVDPIEAAIARRARQSDAQCELPFAEEWDQILADRIEGNRPSVVSMPAFHPPAVAQPAADARALPPPPTLDLDNIKSKSTSDLKPKVPLGVDVLSQPGGSAGATAAEEAQALAAIYTRQSDLRREQLREQRNDPKPIRIAALEAASPQMQLNRDAKIQHYVTLIKQTVDDERLYDDVAYKAAAAVVDGVWPVSRLQGVLNSLAKAKRVGFAKPETTPAIYFALAAKRSMHEHDGATR